MNSEKWASEIISEVDLSSDKTDIKRFVDIDATSSFAHFTPNLTVDEIFGYKRIETLEKMSEGKLNIMPFDYDGSFSSKEKPSGNFFETPFKDGSDSVLPLIFFRDLPMRFQDFNPERITRAFEKPWKQLIKSSGFKKTDYFGVGERFNLILNEIKKSVGESNNSQSFLINLRKNFLRLSGIFTNGVPESTRFDLFSQKLEEDLEAGFPFWKMELPEKAEAKHKSNDSTFLFYGVDNSSFYHFNLRSVKFFSNPDRFEFDKGNERVIIRAEEASDAMLRGIIVPTVTLLNYIVLGPARKPKNNNRKIRLHVAGNYMAGENGYAKPLIPYFNKIPGFDEVKLVCTGYDGRGIVKGKQKDFIGFGSIFPYFGRLGLERCLESGSPYQLKIREPFVEAKIKILPTPNKNVCREER